MKDQPEFPALALLASRGLLAPDTWKCKRAQVSLKATIDVPLLGTIIEHFFLGRRPLPFGGSHLRLPSGPAGIRTTTGSLSALARQAQSSNKMVMGFWKTPTCQWDGHYTSMVPLGNVVFIFFFSSSLADVALRLGPYMSISSEKKFVQRTQLVQMSRQIKP